MKKISKVISLLIAICMCFSMLPTNGVFADETYVTYGKTIPSDYSGHVVKYQTIDTEKNGKIVKVDVGVYGVGLSNGYRSHIGFDTNVLKYCKPDGANISVAALYSNAVVTATYNSDLTDVEDLWETSLTASGMLLSKDTVSSAEAGAVKNYYVTVEQLDSSTTALFKGTYSNNSWCPPANTFVHLYSIYLKLQDGKTFDDIKSDTIYMLTGAENDPNGNCINGSKVVLEGNVISENTLMLNFPEATYSAEFNVTDGSSAIEGATVTVKQNGNQKGTGTTDSTGTATITGLTAGSYTYEVAKNGYASSSDSLTVSNGDVTKSVTLTKQTISHNVTFTVTDTDNQPLSGVTIDVGGVQKVTTSDGTAVAALTDGKYDYTAELVGYDKKTGSVTVNGGNVNEKITMSKTTVPKYTYTFTVNDDSGNPIKDADVTVYNQAGTSTVAEQETDESGVATFNLEEGSYQYAVSAGYWYSSVALTPFSVSSLGTNNSATPTLTKKSAAEGPKYYVKGSYAEDTGKYTVNVYLKDAKAVGASFGLKYDSKILTLDSTDGIKYDESLITVTGSGTDGFAPQQNENGYVTFGWNAINDGTNNYVDATTTEQLLVTYTFTATKGDLDKWVDSTTLTAMDYTKTTQGGKDSVGVIGNIWNTETSKYRGLLLGDNDADSEQDIDMVFEYDDQDRQRLTFKVVDSANTATVIKDATINVFDSMAMDTDLGPITTDKGGIAEIVVKGNGTYMYMASAAKYWSNPESEKAEDYNEVKDVTEPTEIEVKLRAKEYYDVEVNVTDGTVISGDKTVTDDTLGDSTATTETWTDAAVNGIDFTFVTTPAAGYEIDGTPQYKIGDSGTDTDAEFDTEKNCYYVPGTAITDKVTLTVKYKAGTFDVTANMNDGGTLAWDSESLTDTDMPKTKSFNNGADSGELKFTADEGNVIYQVVINGTDYPLPTDSETEFAYEFKNITEDNTITVIFKAKDAVNPSQYVVSVVAGKYGKVSVTNGDAVDAEEVVGTASQDFIVDWEKSLKAVVTPDSGYEIDKVLVDGAEETVSDKKTHTVTVSAKADKQTIAATFKAEGSQDSIQYLISTVVSGMGTVEPIGNKLYFTYETPTYTFTADQKWTIDKIEFNGEDKTSEITGGSYTFSDGVTEDVEINVVFKEIVKTVSGSVNYAQGTVTEAGKITATLPNVVFTRTSDGAEFVVESDKMIAATALKTGEANANFTIDLPNGEYTITTTKHGHLSYTITGYEVKIDDGENQTSASVENTIVLIPGNTNQDDVIGFMDILRVVNGMARYGVGAADIDQSGSVTIDDMNYAKGNYAAEAVNVTYEQHKTPSGS